MHSCVRRLTRGPRAVLTADGWRILSKWEHLFSSPAKLREKNTCGQFIWCSDVFPNIFGVTEGLWYQKPDFIGFQMFHRKNINKRDKGYIISCKFNFCSYIHEIFMEMMFKNSFLTTPIVIIVYNYSSWTNSSIYAIPMCVMFYTEFLALFSLFCASNALRSFRVPPIMLIASFKLKQKAICCRSLAITARVSCYSS